MAMRAVGWDRVTMAGEVMDELDECGLDSRVAKWQRRESKWRWQWQWQELGHGRCTREEEALSFLGTAVSLHMPNIAWTWRINSRGLEIQKMSGLEEVSYCGAATW